MNTQKDKWIYGTVVTVLSLTIMMSTLIAVPLIITALFIQQLLFGPGPAATGGPSVSLARSYVRR